MPRRVVSMVAAVIAAASIASAQVPARTKWVTTVACGSKEKPGDITPSTLAEFYYAGDWMNLQKNLVKLLVD